MSVVKVNGIAGAVAAFTPQQSSPVPPVEDDRACKPTMSPLDMVMRGLEHLDIEQRKSVLRSVFEEELHCVMQEAREVGYQEGVDNALAEVQPRIASQLEEARRNASLWHQALEAAHQQAVWTLDDDTLILFIIAEAVSTLLTVEVSSSDYPERLLQQLVQKYAQQGIRQCRLPPDIYNASQHLDFTEFECVPDETLTPGSYRLEVSAGNIEHQLSTVFDAFQHGVVGLLKQKDTPECP